MPNIYICNKCFKIFKEKPEGCCEDCELLAVPVSLSLLIAGMFMVFNKGHKVVIDGNTWKRDCNKGIITKNGIEVGDDFKDYYDLLSMNWFNQFIDYCNSGAIPLLNITQYAK